MKTLPTIPLLAAAWQTSLAAVQDSANRPDVTCRLLQTRFPGAVLFPGSEAYNVESTHHWSATAYGKPACVFMPTNTTQVSVAVRAIALARVQFAVRGGGHGPNPLFANTNGGILIPLSGLNRISLSNDRSVVSVGPGLRWGDVGDFLEPYGLVPAGGHNAAPGVAGVTLGGGLGYYGNQYGMAADNVVAYEVVLASGSVVTATARQHPDLYWALKGGANNFGIVTRFDLRTHYSPRVCLGQVTVPLDQADTFLDAIADFTHLNDGTAAILPGILHSGEQPTYGTRVFYNGVECNQPSLANFTSIPGAESTYGNTTTLSAYQKLPDPHNDSGLRHVMRTISSYATGQALRIIRDTYQELLAEIADMPHVVAGQAIMPIMKNLIQAGNDNGGNPQGMDIDDAPYIWHIIHLIYTDEADDQRLFPFGRRITSEMTARLAAAGELGGFTHLNSAGGDQEIFPTYGRANLDRLYRIREQYDPDLVFKILLPGGFKLP